MATPPLLVELLCPSCQAHHWVIDADFRAAYMDGGVDVGYKDREYSCRACGQTGRGHEVLQKSPPTFLIGGRDFDDTTVSYWEAILRQHLPDHHRPGSD